MASKHLDSLVRSFLSGSNAFSDFDPFVDLQDPTYMSFKIDFFPNQGLSIPKDAYSSGGLFRPPSPGTSLTNYDLSDSAADYLARIGAPTAQAALQKFTDLLFDIQEKAPWYFQSISGLADLYKIDKAINYRGKDKVIAIDCLESVDLRMTMLADLYRLFSFDFKNWREILPINLRTFDMRIHVLEMRKFNTTFGTIADYYAERPFDGEERQKEFIEAQSKKNVYGGIGSSLFSGTFNALGNFSSAINNATGGLFSNLGELAGNDPNTSLESAFEAISVQTFNLGHCEFDFFTEAPPYLDTVSVKEATEATFKFKINIGTIERSTSYSFYDYIISEWAKNTRTPSTLSLDFGNLSRPYYEEFPHKAPERGDASKPFAIYEDYRKSIFPDTQSQAKAYAEVKKESDQLRKGPLENALGRIVGNAVPQINGFINSALGDLTGGVLGTAPLGNIYEKRGFFQNAQAALNDFFTPGDQIGNNNSATVNPDKLSKDILVGAEPVKETLPKDTLTGASPVKDTLLKDTLTGAAPKKEGVGNNVFKP